MCRRSRTGRRATAKHRRADYAPHIPGPQNRGPGVAPVTSDEDREDRMKMRRVIGAVVLVMLSAGSVASQAQAYAVGADGKMQQEKQAPLIPSDQQPTTEQLSKLFDVMRIKQQMQSMRQMVPSMVQEQIQAA